MKKPRLKDINCQNSFILTGTVCATTQIKGQKNRRDTWQIDFWVYPPRSSGPSHCQAYGNLASSLLHGEKALQGKSIVTCSGTLYLYKQHYFYNRYWNRPEVAPEYVSVKHHSTILRCERVDVHWEAGDDIHEYLLPGPIDARETRVVLT